ncbi:MAG: glycosyltransferase family 4 protein, partial [Candidatus Heimdallarchaeota archaeon]|nr:glycosyltransferase family 4 protein [Candidatus Heimdallarchaeota archaeon]MCK4877394.1 glycosyltransferase family 4 protein [Candidatus Heimdallarchaeota archaeon]
LKNSKIFKEELRDFKPDIIFTSDPFFTTSCALIARKQKSPIVLRIGAVYDSFYAGRLNVKIFRNNYQNPFFKIIKFLLNRMSRIIFKKVDQIVFNSEFLKNNFQKEAPESYVIYNGVEERNVEFKEISEKLKLVFVGRIEPRKSIEIIIEAANILKHDNVDFSLSIIGDIEHDREYWKKINDLIETNNLWKYISLEGYVSNTEIASILKKKDILLFPTNDKNFPMTEGLPNVLLEGMSNGLAVISTKVAGVPEIIKKENGILVDSTSENFALAIKELDQNRAMLSKIKRNNEEQIKENFTIRNSAKQYTELFSDILISKSVS